MTSQNSEYGQILVDHWNNSVPIGTPVIVTKDNGVELRTRTRSAAWLLCGTPVAMVDGIAGGYLLTRLRVNRGDNAAA